MKLTSAEIEFLSAWAREEGEPDCYRRPAHRLQLAHKVAGAHFIDLIKVWTEAENKKDRGILEAANNPTPAWPWSSPEEFRLRLEQAEKANTARRKRARGLVPSAESSPPM
ncbi:MAG TPA: hypothetical protein VFA18_05935 [Gemmataceae bacterium]|nr:hypothetical protein [Gemmataceae bacterium]